MPEPIGKERHNWGRRVIRTCPGSLEKNGSAPSSGYAFRNRIVFVHWKTTGRRFGKDGSQLRGAQPEF